MPLRAGRNTVTFRIASLNLNPAIYSVGLWMAGSVSWVSVIDHVEAAFDIEVVSGRSRGFGISSRFDGFVATDFEVTHDGR